MMYHREAVLAEMGVALREDGLTVGVYSPKKVSIIETKYPYNCWYKSLFGVLYKQ